MSVAAFLHDGCADTLEARFGPCGGYSHGRAVLVGADGIADLVAYLETL